MVPAKALMIALSVLAAGGPTGPATDGSRGAADRRAKAFVREYERTVRPLINEAALAQWQASVAGTDANFRASEEAWNRVDEALSNKSRFAELKRIRAAKVRDATLSRQVDLLHLQYLGKQVSPALLSQITAKATSVEKAFVNFRARVGGREMPDSEVRQVLKTSTDSAERKAVWEASKAVGPEIEADLKVLVKLRNQVARELGFKDFHRMTLYLDEQRQEEVLRLFDELDSLAREPLAKVKRDLDLAIAKRFGVEVADLRPWHYRDPFFQEAPGSSTEVLDAAYAKADVVLLARAYFEGIGLPVGDVLSRSDLFERKGKNPHAFAFDLDRAGDVRILTNVVPNAYWASTLVHELGHAVYSSEYIPATVPFVLRMPAHTLATEGVATLVGRLPHQVEWMRAMGLEVPDAEKVARMAARDRRDGLLVLAQWCQVMFRFEAAMYANPDQELNKLWWDLVERYQGIRAPPGRGAPDYAAKIHIAMAPAYYHNYLIAELFAAQLHEAIAREIGMTDPRMSLPVGRKEVGAFLRKRVVEPGATLDWRQLTMFATGEELNARAFSRELE